MAHTVTMLRNAPCEAFFGSSGGNVRAPSLRSSASNAPDASGSSAVNAVDATGGRTRASPTHASSVTPNTVPMCLMEKLAFTQA